MSELSELDVAILDFEAHAPRAVGAKEAAIREQLDMSPVRYHQRLNQLVDDPAALAAAPVLVGRLRRLRNRRADLRRAAPPLEEADS
ncbi:DUF3263 domain-containing protein [Corynebacterium lizhenjunii]|uniref:DUF3263 domain-containing protein n=1 Tax=Corynebacterium lizhenjunii TaxID=2709394 RepID=A0A7T0PBP0_9CORY|nr:DUF3263 domain-containing protein [Corynebacterium lizhenjunii]QPK78927.1 DUF3263 domain-containing protein [Corynebacterium lizhenjunii]